MDSTHETEPSSVRAVRAGHLPGCFPYDDGTWGCVYDCPALAGEPKKFPQDVHLRLLRAGTTTDGSSSWKNLHKRHRRGLIATAAQELIRLGLMTEDYKTTGRGHAVLWQHGGGPKDRRRER